MSPHPDLRPLMVESGSPRPERLVLLAHLSTCPECRATLAQEDPSLLFSLLALEPVPREMLDRVSVGVEAAIDREIRRAPMRRAVAFGSLAASILLAGFLTTQLWNRTPSDLASTTHADEVLSPPAALEPFEETAMPAGMIQLLESPGKADRVSAFRALP